MCKTDLNTEQLCCRFDFRAVIVFIASPRASCCDLFVPESILHQQAGPKISRSIFNSLYTLTKFYPHYYFTTLSPYLLYCLRVLLLACARHVFV